MPERILLLALLLAAVPGLSPSADDTRLADAAVNRDLGMLRTLLQQKVNGLCRVGGPDFLGDLICGLR